MSPLSTNQECLAIREEFSALLDGELSSEERETVEAHLSGCSECLRELDAFQRVGQAYQRLPAVTAPHDFADAVRDALNPKVARFPRLPMRAYVLAAAALIVVSVPVYLITLQARDSQPLIARIPGPTGGQMPPESALDSASVAASAPAADAAASDENAGDFRSLQAAPPAELAAAAVGELRDDIVKEEMEGDENRAAEEAFVAGSELAQETAREPAPRARAAFPPITAGARNEAEPIFESARTSADAFAPSRQTLEKSAGVAMPQAAPPASPAAAVAGPPAAAAPSPQDVPPARDEASTALVETRANETAPQFTLRDGIWYESGYAGEPLTDVTRSSEAFARLLLERPALTGLLANYETAVFKAGDRWYRLIREN